ncbi:MAG TPA: response regulator [Vicinamibacterales bacterium]|nr:response regulator [Vicinamibacterales bacterium]
MARILIIDDDPAVSLTLARMLELEGHAVSRVGNAVEGLSAAATDPPDAVILDIRMPGMNGLEFLRELRSDTRLSRLPVGIITGDYFLSEQVLGEIGSLGAIVRYKPVWLADLSALARALLSGAT